MLKVAYKVAMNIPGLPNGFIQEHFETDQDSVEGYLITSKENFSNLLANNAALMQAFDAQNGVVTTPPAQKEKPKVAEPIAPEVLAERQALEDKAKQDMELFKQFMAWKALQSNS